jgi:hypothetical protein
MVSVAFVSLFFGLIPIVFMGLAFWLLLRIVNLLQRIAIELETVSRLLQSRT